MKNQPLFDQCKTRTSDNEMYPDQPSQSDANTLASAKIVYIPIEGEQWRQVPGFPSLEASSLGRIRYRDSGHILAITGGPNYEYPRVSFQHCGKRTTREIHALAARAFLGTLPAGHVVNHKNGNKYDCRVDNLEFVTAQRNSEHALQNGLGGGKLKPRDVQAIRKLLVASVDVVTVAEAFAVKPAAIQNIGAGRSWRAIPNEPKPLAKNLPLNFMETTN